MMYNCNNHKTIFSHNKGVPVANSIHHSNSIYNYFKSLKLGLFLSDVYLNHLMIIMVSVFLRGYRGKTIDFAEVSCMHRTTTAYFLNHGKWDDSALQDILKVRVIHTIYQEAYRSGKPIFCIVDDTIASKTKPSSQAMHPIEDAYFHQSHLKRKQDYDHQAVAVMLSCNGIVLNYAFVLYNKSISKIDIVQNIAKELPEPPVMSYFLCDCWYVSEKIINTFVQKGFHTIGALKTNRLLYPSGMKKKLSELAAELSVTEKGFDPVTVKNRKYYVCRWTIGVFFRQCKTRLALDTYQIRSSKGIQRYWLLMSMAHYICVISTGQYQSFQEGYQLIRSTIQQEKYQYLFQCAKSCVDFEAFMKLAG